MYLAPDHLGSTIMVTDEMQKVLSQTVHEPFGNTMYEKNDDVNANENKRKSLWAIQTKQTQCLAPVPAWHLCLPWIE